MDKNLWGVPKDPPGLNRVNDQNQKLTARVQTLEKLLDGVLSVDPNAPCFSH